MDYIHRRFVKNWLKITGSDKRGRPVKQIMEDLVCGHAIVKIDKSERTKDCLTDMRRCYDCGREAVGSGERK